MGKRAINNINERKDSHISNTRNGLEYISNLIVLVVDDENCIREILYYVLDGMGFDETLANIPVQGLDIFILRSVGFMLFKPFKTEEIGIVVKQIFDKNEKDFMLSAFQ